MYRRQRKICCIHVRTCLLRQQSMHHNSIPLSHALTLGLTRSSKANKAFKAIVKALLCYDILEGQRPRAKTPAYGLLRTMSASPANATYPKCCKRQKNIKRWELSSDDRGSSGSTCCLNRVEKDLSRTHGQKPSKPRATQVSGTDCTCTGVTIPRHKVRPRGLGGDGQVTTKKGHNCCRLLSSGEALPLRSTRAVPRSFQAGGMSPMLAWIARHASHDHAGGARLERYYSFDHQLH